VAQDPVLDTPRHRSGGVDPGEFRRREQTRLRVAPMVTAAALVSVILTMIVLS
jgi:hypothetical protein